jgi:hypothetical protein
MGARHTRWDPDNRSFAVFCDALFARPVGEEAWRTESARRRDWKPRAYFLALNVRHCGNFSAVVRAVNAAVGPDGSAPMDAVDLAKLHSALMQYSAPGNSWNELATDMGRMIATVAMPPDRMPVIATAPAVATAVKPAAVDRQVATQVLQLAAEAAPSDSIEAHKDVLVAYRNRARLAPTLSLKRTAQQMLLAALGVPSNEPAARSVMTRYQTSLQPLTVEERNLVVPLLVNALDGPIRLDLAASPTAQALAAALPGVKEWEPRALIHHALAPEAHLNGLQLGKFRRALPPALLYDAEIANAVAAL